MTLMYSIWKTQRTKYLVFSKLELIFFSFVHEDWGRPNNMKPLLFTLSRALDPLFSSFYPNAISIVFLGYDKWSLLETVKITMKLVYLKLFIYYSKIRADLYTGMMTTACYPSILEGWIRRIINLGLTWITQQVRIYILRYYCKQNRTKIPIEVRIGKNCVLEVYWGSWHAQTILNVAFNFAEPLTKTNCTIICAIFMECQSTMKELKVSVYRILLQSKNHYARWRAKRIGPLGHEQPFHIPRNGTGVLSSSSSSSLSIWHHCDLSVFKAEQDWFNFTAGWFSNLVTRLERRKKHLTKSTLQSQYGCLTVYTEPFGSH